jgi:hypothetical protein
MAISEAAVLYRLVEVSGTGQWGALQPSRSGRQNLPPPCVGSAGRRDALLTTVALSLACHEAACDTMHPAANSDLEEWPAFLILERSGNSTCPLL